MYKVEEDVYETLPDGRMILIAAKGVEVSESEAERLGLLKTSKPQPAETKKEKDGQEETSKKR